jgi:Holliday junction DNA helicase RuvA
LQGNAALLETIKGIGENHPKELFLKEDKMGKIVPESNISSLINNTLEQDALNALTALGIARPAAEQALKKVLANASGQDKLEDIIKKVLKIL